MKTGSQQRMWAVEKKLFVTDRQLGKGYQGITEHRDNGREEMW